MDDNRKTAVGLITYSLSPDASARIVGHEEVMGKFCFLIEDEVRKRGISLSKMEIGAEWAQYADTTGIVIEAYVDGLPEEREALWDAVCDRMNGLQSSMPKKDWQFINEDVSFVVRKA